MQARRWPIMTIGLIVINVVAFLLTFTALENESPELTETRVHIRLLAAMHPELTLSPEAREMVEEFQKNEPEAWAYAKDGRRGVEDAWDAQIRLIDEPADLQVEMDNLCARYKEQRSNSTLENYAYVPAHPTWYSYLTANFLHGGWLHLIGNMWFLWLAGIVLEDAWGRWLYTAVYLVAGIFALQVHAWFNAGSNVATLGASGAVAALMGAFLVRFPKVRIKMAWFWGFFRVSRFSAEAYWLLPVWFVMELFSGVLFGTSSGVAHMAHVGGFVFGAAAALAIRQSGLEHAINQAIEQEIDPNNDAELDAIHDLIAQSQLDEAQTRMQAYLDAAPATSERALTVQQELHWRKNDIPSYCKTTSQLCAFHLGIHALEPALKDYADLAQAGGVLPADIWLKLCHGMEEQGESERALGEYQELAAAYPKERPSLMALMAGARVAMHKVQRPEQALNLYQAAADSAVPHLDLDANIEMGLKQARAALAAAPVH
jgi:membrane associated rhomboid family serine protease